MSITNSQIGSFSIKKHPHRPATSSALRVALSSKPQTRHKAPLVRHFPVLILACIAVLLCFPIHRRSFLRCHFRLHTSPQPRDIGQEEHDQATEHIKANAVSDAADIQASSGKRHEDIRPPPEDADDGVRNERTGKFLKDVGFSRSKCFSESGRPGKHTCSPSVIIAGYEKCGTSALYFKLSTHPSILATRQKEFCPPEDSAASMWSWLDHPSMPTMPSIDEGKLLLNGCIGIVSKPLALAELVRVNPSLKVLVSLRNYADWSYSYYSYRCISGYDDGCEKLRSPNEMGAWKDSRTPENFKRLVDGIRKTGKPPHSAFNVMRPSVALYRPWLERLITIVGREAVMIVKQEDLSFIPRQTLSRVAAFLGIDADGFPKTAFTLVSNTNSRPSQLTTVSESSSASEVAALINSASVIDKDTRITLNEFWKSECDWLRTTFDIHFTDSC